MNDLNLFKYANFSSVSHQQIEQSLIQNGIYSGCLLVGFGITALLLAPSVDELKAMGHIAPLSAQRKSYLENRQSQIKLLTYAGLIISILLTLFFKIGVKKVSAAASGVWIFLVPEIFIQLVCVLYILKYRRHVRFYSCVLLCFTVLGLMSGSKGAVAQILILGVIYVLYERGDFKVSLKKFLIASATIVFLVLASFSIANNIRYTILATGQSYGINLVQSFFYGALQTFQRENVVHLIDLVTSRFNGLDGLLVTNIHQPAVLRDVFSLSNTAQRIVSKLIPFDGGVASMTTGKAVGIFYTGFDSSKSFSGAVGIWGALQLAASGYAALFAISLGSVWAALLCGFQRIRDLDIAFIMQGFVLMMMTESIMSGNFDNTVSWLVIRCFQLVACLVGISLLSPRQLQK